jgi:hypothetical protein
MKLIDNIRQAPRLWSVQLSALLVAWSALPLDMQAALVQLVGIPPERVPGILALLVIVARLVQQPALQQPQERQP